MKSVKEEFCNICEKSCLSIFQKGMFNKKTGNLEGEILENEMLVLQGRFGYNSNHDGDMYQANICETCFFDKIMPLMKINPYAGNYLFPDDDDKTDSVEIYLDESSTTALTLWQCWKSEDGYTFGIVSSINELRKRGLLEDDAVLKYEFYSASYDEAMKEYYKRQGWGEYIAIKDD